MISSALFAQCDCVLLPAKEAESYFELVFRGTVQSYSHSVAVFRVSRVWKGHITRNYEMPAMGSAELCDGFPPRLLVAGNELIVYARRVQSQWGDYVYFPLHCQTRLAKDARQDLRQLGRGHKPRR